MKFQQNAEELLNTMFPPPEFDVDLCMEILEQIERKTSLISPDSNLHAKSITEKIGWLCTAFEHNFYEEIDEYVGDENYGVRVFLSRKNPIEFIFEN